MISSRRTPSNPSLRGGRPAGNAGRASNVEPSVNALGLIVLARPAGNDRHNTRPQPRHSGRGARGIRGIYSLGGLALCGCHPVVLGLDGLRETPVVRKANSGEIPRPSTNFSSAGRPSYCQRARAAVPDSRLSGAAPNTKRGDTCPEKWCDSRERPATFSNWLGREVSKILAKVWVIITGKSEAQGRRDARPARVIYSALDHIIHGVITGSVVGCAFFTWLEIFNG